MSGDDSIVIDSSDMNGTLDTTEPSDDINTTMEELVPKKKKKKKMVDVGM